MKNKYPPSGVLHFHHGTCWRTNTSFCNWNRNCATGFHWYGGQTSAFSAGINQNIGLSACILKQALWDKCPWPHSHMSLGFTFPCSDQRWRGFIHISHPVSVPHCAMHTVSTVVISIAGHGLGPEFLCFFFLWWLFPLYILPDGGRRGWNKLTKPCSYCTCFSWRVFFSAHVWESNIWSKSSSKVNGSQLLLMGLWSSISQFLASNPLSLLALVRRDAVFFGGALLHLSQADLMQLCGGRKSALIWKANSTETVCKFLKHPHT